MMNATWDSAILDAIWNAQPQEPLPLLLLRDMSLIADEHGRAPIVTLATRFRNFFRKRRAEYKAELAQGDIPGATDASAVPGEWTIERWAETVVTRGLVGMNRDFMHRDGEELVWNADRRARWSPGFRKALRNVAEAKLIEYFERNVEGGW
jgi:hypothetical protein